MPQHTVVILGGKKPARVVPGNLLVDPGDSVTFDARGTDAYISFSGNWPFTQAPQDPICVTSKQKVKLDIVPAAAAILDEYPYKAFCTSTFDLAVGNSEPGIIIKR